MDNIRHILRTAFLSLPWLLALPFAACSAIDDDVPTTDGTATLRFSITAREEGDLNTRAPGDVVGEEVGTNHEYIHHLCVLIVGEDGTVVKKLLPVLTGNTAAQQGNLRTWQSEEISLPAATYTIYAFANIDTEYSTLWGSLTGVDEGIKLSDYKIDDIVLEDNPSSKINFAQYFIPMSARQQVTVTPATTGISIGLDRLVSKVRISLTGTPGSKVTSLTFGGYADRIGLFKDTATPDVSYDTDTSVVVNPITIGNGETRINDFYVNSSPKHEGYTVTLTTDEMGGTTYIARTKLDNLPRNSIYPLLLQLQDFALDITPRCWLSPIGSYPVEVRAALTQDNAYIIEIPEGSQFELALNGVSLGSAPAATDVSCTWTFDAASATLDGLDIEKDYIPGSTTVRGHVTASAGQTFPLTCEASWTLDGTDYHRTYTVLVQTTDITEAEFITTSTNAQTNFGLLRLDTEMLNMIRR